MSTTVELAGLLASSILLLARPPVLAEPHRKVRPLSRLQFPRSLLTAQKRVELLLTVAAPVTSLSSSTLAATKCRPDVRLRLSSSRPESNF